MYSYTCCAKILVLALISLPSFACKMRKRGLMTDIPKTMAAIQFIERAHRGQFRKHSGLPYIVHCFNVYAIVKEYKESKNHDELGAISLLHDTLEDSVTTHAELTEIFGSMVADAVQELTNSKEKIKKMGKRAYMDEKLLTMSNYALMVKLADMLANITDAARFGILERINHHIETLKSHRKLTDAQKKVVEHIETFLGKI